MTGKIMCVSTHADGNRGLLQPDDGGPLLPFDEADTLDGQTGNTKTLTASLYGASVTYIFDGASGKAKRVRFT